MSAGLTYDLGAVLKWSVPLMWVLFLVAGASVIDAALLLRFAALAPELSDQAEIDAWATGLDQRSSAIGIAYLVAVIACLVANGIWIYRASWNAREMAGGIGNAGKRIAPGWAVGWYFVPLANLVMPLTAMKETWTASHRGSEAPGWLLWWWGAWVVSTLLGRLSSGMAEDADVIEDFWAVGLVQLSSVVLFFVAALLFLNIMRQVTAAQALSSRDAIFA